MRRITGKGKKMMVVLTVAGMLAGSACPTYATVVGNMAGEQDIVAQPITEETQQGDIIALDDIGISIEVSGYTSIRESDGFVYIYTMADDSIPYVIIGKYDAASVNFVNEFTKYMAENYSDLQVTEDIDAAEIGGRTFTKIGYTYTASGYTVRDRRLFYSENDRTYMFGTKEIESLGYYTGDMMEQAAGSMAYLAGGDSDYANHVDRERSVTGGSQKAVEDIQQATGDAASQQPSATDGTVSSSIVGSIAGNENTNTEGTTSSGSIVFDETKAPYSGTWVPFQDGFKLYLPSDWNTYELTQEEINQGVLYVAGDASSGEENPPSISVVWAYSDDAETLEDIATAIQQAGYQVDDIVTINGFGCVTYRLESENCSAVMFFHPTNKDYVFCVTGSGYVQNVDIINSVLTSLSQYSE